MSVAYHANTVAHTKTEWRAYEWLLSDRKLDAVELVHGEESSDPTFIYYGITGYDVKTLNRHTLTIDYNKYQSLLEWKDHGELLVFNHNSIEPCKIIPFGKLPVNGGKYDGINFNIRKISQLQSMIGVSRNEKDIMEKLRSQIELNAYPQSDWGDILLQSMYCMLADQNLITLVNVYRMSRFLFGANCPQCQTQNILTGKPKLYWMVNCSKCKYQFVAKHKVK